MLDLRKALEAGGCKPNHGCNAASTCVCGLVEEAADEIERLRAALAGMVKAFEKNPGDGRDFERGEVPELDAAKDALAN